MKIILTVGAIIIIVLLALLFIDTGNKSYTLGNSELSFPQTFSVVEKAYIPEEWAPNGYCGIAQDNDLCATLLLIYPDKASAQQQFILSYPKQFSLLASDAQECFKEEMKTITLQSIEIPVTYYYHNIDQIEYMQENIDTGKSPYVCTQVDISEENFHHAAGCSTEGICVWVDKQLGREKFYQAIEALN